MRRGCVQDHSRLDHISLAFGPAVGRSVGQLEGTILFSVVQASKRVLLDAVTERSIGQRTL